MGLQEQLDEQWRRTSEHSPEIRDAYEALVGDLKRSGFAAGARKDGEALPDFELPSVDGRLLGTAELLARGPLVLSFFRGGWCPYCTLELQALQQALPEIERLGATLVAVTPDTGAPLAAAKRDNGLAYEVLSDVDNGLGLTLGIIFRVPEAIRLLYRRRGIDLGTRHGTSDDAWLLPLPATYVVDRTGIIRHAELEPDFKRRMEPSQIIRVLEGLVAGDARIPGPASGGG